MERCWKASWGRPQYRRMAGHVSASRYLCAWVGTLGLLLAYGLVFIFLFTSHGLGCAFFMTSENAIQDYQIILDQWLSYAAQSC